MVEAWQIAGAVEDLLDVTRLYRQAKPQHVDHAAAVLEGVFARFAKLVVEAASHE